MKCPHCLENFNDTEHRVFLAKDSEGFWGVQFHTCPSEKCRRVIIYLISGDDKAFPPYQGGTPTTRALVRPKGAARPGATSEVPSAIAADYNEASLVLPDSPKASAALSRRCLQSVLREAAGVRARNLWTEIEEVISKQLVPSFLATQLHSLREVGNFAAHPAKSEHSGEIIDVEPTEAEWNLDVLEGLFDFFYVQPARAAERKANLNAKLKEAGKNEIA